MPTFVRSIQPLVDMRVLGYAGLPHTYHQARARLFSGTPLRSQRYRFVAPRSPNDRLPLYTVCLPFTTERATLPPYLYKHCWTLVRDRRTVFLDPLLTLRQFVAYWRLAFRLDGLHAPVHAMVSAAQPFRVYATFLPAGLPALTWFCLPLVYAHTRPVPHGMPF